MRPGDTMVFATLSEVQSLVEAFESAELPSSEWNHRAQLAVAAWYLSRLTETEAAERFIMALRRYNYTRGIAAGGTEGYHETVTLFWLSFARSFLLQSSPGRTRLDRINNLVARFADRADLILDFYRPETLHDFEARRRWVEPDRRPLESLEVLCRGGDCP